MPDSPAIAAYRVASAATQEKLLAVLQADSEALGGLEGQFNTVAALLGSIGVTVLEAKPTAWPRIKQWMLDVALHIATATSRPQ